MINRPEGEHQRGRYQVGRKGQQIIVGATPWNLGSARRLMFLIIISKFLTLTRCRDVIQDRAQHD